MNIICVDDEKLLAENTASLCRQVGGVDEVLAFEKPSDALAFFDEGRADVAILDIDMPEMTGIELAKRIKLKQPGTKVIFLTGYPQYAVDSYKVRASGYLLKPVDEEELLEEINYALSQDRKKTKAHISVQTFGGFDLFVDGELVRFKQKKCKELLAVLVDRRGSSVTRAEAFAYIYEDRMYDRPMQKQFDAIIRSMRETLREYNIDEIFEMKNGQMRICSDKFDCDLYRFFDGDVDAINSFGGDYMSSYSWASMTEGIVTWKWGGEPKPE